MCETVVTRASSASAAPASHPFGCYPGIDVSTPEVDRSEARLLPSERVLWYGGPARGVPRARRWTVGPALIFTLAVVFGLFAALLAVAGMPGVRQTASLAAMLALFGISVAVAPRYLHDTCEYLVTDRRVLFRRGRFRRSMDRTGITYGRVRWHRSVPGVGSLELVRAVPCGPLARRQRLVPYDVREPDRLSSSSTATA